MDLERLWYISREWQKDRSYSSANRFGAEALDALPMLLARTEIQQQQIGDFKAISDAYDRQKPEMAQLRADRMRLIGQVERLSQAYVDTATLWNVEHTCHHSTTREEAYTEAKGQAEEKLKEILEGACTVK